VRRAGAAVVGVERGPLVVVAAGSAVAAKPSRERAAAARGAPAEQKQRKAGEDADYGPAI
jgi:hypothetical protein